MREDAFEPEQSYRLAGAYYLVLAAPANLPRWVAALERGSWQGALVGGIVRLFVKEDPVEVRIVRSRRRISLRWETVRALSFASVSEANEVAREWDRQLGKGVVPQMNQVPCD